MKRQVGTAIDRWNNYVGGRADGRTGGAICIMRRDEDEDEDEEEKRQST